jgi:hypothetical protein
MMGDGVSELLRVVCAPCRRHGGLFDQTQDLQQIGSVLILILLVAGFVAGIPGGFLLGWLAFQ